MAQIINLAAATKPRVSARGRQLCKELIGLGMARSAITSLVLGKDLKNLTHNDINAGHAVINSCYKELGYGIVDARHGRSPLMAAAIRAAASRCRMRVRVA